MSIQAGLVGLPNVGKSTLFNALTRSSVPAQNYPFCTIDPHVACSSVPDPRIPQLQAWYESKKTLPAVMEFVDIAGLVAGAASGQGLGNKFLSNIREVDIILHVLRCFNDPDITRDMPLDPFGDYQIIVSELMIKDLESVTKRIAKIDNLKRSHSLSGADRKTLEDEQRLMERVEQALNHKTADDVYNLLAASDLRTIPLLCAKRSLIIANIAEDQLDDKAYANDPAYQLLITTFGADRVIPISARLEYELSQLSAQDAQALMGPLGMEDKGLDKIITATYRELGLITFFTCGPKEIHAWTIKNGTTIKQAGGCIHSDIERGFIAADVFGCNDLEAVDGKPSRLKEKGTFRTEGASYIVKDGDVINIKFNV
ncbi:redox-regulated ATPase YchF [bacterium]|jgi:ribosome-binding ATPase|nr:redox-regulated ATPase YchF [bacterium]MBT3903505.1 redox-regulated ATPase YchF [bacterium]MBT5345997.1 redox-regulated ATPase YchF [bacterium]MBT6131234.1 redox-regulated ATPase YchF [bacterium]MBT6528839.1 redox-regulated ATPase YchF [bacterium]